MKQSPLFPFYYYSKSKQLVIVALLIIIIIPVAEHTNTLNKRCNNINFSSLKGFQYFFCCFYLANNPPHSPAFPLSCVLIIAASAEKRLFKLHQIFPDTNSLNIRNYKEKWRGKQNSWPIKPKNVWKVILKRLLEWLIGILTHINWSFFSISSSSVKL